MKSIKVILLSVFIFSCYFADASPFIFNVEDYNDQGIASIWEKLKERVEIQPINLFFLVIFIIAIVHSFFSHRLMRMSKAENRIIEQIGIANPLSTPKKVSSTRKIRFWELLYFFSEIEIIFGLWCIPVLIAITYRYGWESTFDYLNREKYQESLFIVVAMAVA